MNSVNSDSIQLCLKELQSLLAKILNDVVIQTRLQNDEEFQRRVIDQLTSHMRRKQELESALKEQSLRREQAVETQKSLQSQLQECRRYGRYLCRNTESAMNSLFSSLHVTIIGDILSLFFVC